MIAAGGGQAGWAPVSCLQNVFEGVLGLARAGKARLGVVAHSAPEACKGLQSSCPAPSIPSPLAKAVALDAKL